MELENNIEVGDFFKIKKSDYNKNCKSPNKEYNVISLSKSEKSVYFYDKRTNNPCDCQECKEFSNKNIGLKCIAKTAIILTKKYKQYIREKKLKQILN